MEQFNRFVGDGFEVVLYQVAAGEVFTFNYAVNAPRSRHPTMSIVSKGTRVFRGHGGAPIVQRPGDTSRELPDIQAGVDYSHTFPAGGEFFCIGRLDRKPLTARKIQCAVGEDFLLQVGQHVLLVSGDTNYGAAPRVLRASAGDRVVTATSDLTAVVF